MSLVVSIQETQMDLIYDVALSTGTGGEILSGITIKTEMVCCTIVDFFSIQQNVF